MFVLDTDILSLAFEGHAGVAKRIAGAEAAGEVVAITVLTRAEMMKGRIEYLLKAADKAHWLRAQDLLRRTEDQLAGVTVLPVTEAAADYFERLRATRKRKKGTHADLLIASIALANAATFVTRNTKDFAGVPNLTLENWAA
jgi:tRNA(fMet)-specific endonuclease VapC